MEYSNSLEFALNLDSKDTLDGFQDNFHFPLSSEGNKLIYFCGNSLGLQPKKTREYVDQELLDWAELAVDGHFKAKTPWLPYHEYLCEPMARVVGANPSEVVVMNSLTVNLHLMMVSFFQPKSDRQKNSGRTTSISF